MCVSLLLPGWLPECRPTVLTHVPLTNFSSSLSPYFFYLLRTYILRALGLGGTEKLQSKTLV